MQDIINRISKIQSINNITTELSQNFVFPRENTSKQGNAENIKENYFMDDYEIEGIVMRALIEAKEGCLNLGIQFDEDSWRNIEIINVQTEIDVTDDYNLCHQDIKSQVIHDEDCDGANSDIPSDIPSECIDEQNLLHFKFGETINMKTYNKEQTDEASTFVNVQINDKNITMRKSSLCWLLDDNSRRYVIVILNNTFTDC